MHKLRNLLNTYRPRKYSASLLLSCITIVIICTLIVGVFSCHIINKAMTDYIIYSNNKLLNQYKSSIDLAVINAVNEITIKMMRDVKSNYYLERFFSEPLENNLADIHQVDRYLNEISVLNP